MVVDKIMDGATNQPFILIADYGSIGPHTKNFPICAKTDVLDPCQDLTLEIFLQIIIIDTRPDKPIKRLKIFNKCDFRQLFLLEQRLCQIVPQQPCFPVTDYRGDGANHILADQIPKLDGRFSFEKWFLGKKIDNLFVHPAEEIVAPTVVPAHRPQQLNNHGAQFLRALLVLVELVVVGSDGIGGLHPFPDIMFDPQIVLPLQVIDQLNNLAELFLQPAFVLVLIIIFYVFYAFLVRLIFVDSPETADKGGQGGDDHKRCIERCRRKGDLIKHGLCNLSET
jgi:hypothetical protein